MLRVRDKLTLTPFLFFLFDRGGDVTDGMIEEAKRDLFRDLDDV